MPVEDGVESHIGAETNVLLVDMSAGVVSHIRPAGEIEDVAVGFAEEDPFAFPEAATLQALALSWIQDNQDALSAGWLTAEETVANGEETPKAKATPKRTRRTGPGKASPSGEGMSPKQKRPTTASLQASLDQVLGTLPGLSNQMQALMDRQTALESQMGKTSSTARVLSQPLVPQVPPPSVVSKVAHLVPPPPKSYTQVATASAQSKPAELIELEMEKESHQSDLARAMMAQSTAVTALVAQLAGASQDPMSDLQLSSSSGTKGAVGRAKLQSELAQHRGTFFDSMVRSMARRMSPTASADRPRLDLLAAGVSGTRYLERFGGYGKQKELGIIMRQIMTAVDFLMADNVPAAKDCIGLTAVMIEQACLGNGRFEFAQILTMQEDVPAAVFTNRQLALTSRARAFSPLADQKWVATSIAFLKELDTIWTKPSELLSGQGMGSSAGSGTGDQPGAKAKASSKKKGRGKGGRGQANEGAEEEEAA